RHVFLLCFFSAPPARKHRDANKCRMIPSLATNHRTVDDVSPYFPPRRPSLPPPHTKSAPPLPVGRLHRATEEHKLVSLLHLAVLVLEREAEATQQCAAFFVVRGGGDDGDVHTARTVHLVHVDLVEHGLLGEAEGVVAVAVELAVGEAAEVTNTRQCDREQAVQELPHAVATQGDAGADWHALAQLEVSDCLLRGADLRLLTGDCGQVSDCAVDHLGVPCRVADAHVDDNLGHAWRLDDVVEVELSLQRFPDFLTVLSLQTRSVVVAHP